MDNDEISRSYQDQSFSKHTPQGDYTNAAQHYMALNSRNLIDESDDQEFTVHSPQQLIPKFLQDLDTKTSVIYCESPDRPHKERSASDHYPLRMKLESDSSINFVNDSNTYKYNVFHKPRRIQSDMMNPSAQMIEYGQSQIGTSTKETKDMQDEREINSGDEDNVKSDGNIIDNYAAALVARVKVKGAFNNAAENRVFDASNHELVLINDKAYIVDYKGIEKKQRVLRSQRRKGPRLRLILQKHGILSENLGRKKKPTSKVSRRKSTIGDLQVKLNSLRDSTKTCWAKLTGFLLHKKEDLCDLISHSYINPNGKFRWLWDFASMMFIFYDLVNVPFIICFDVPSTQATFFLDAFKDIFFMIDVCLNFKTGYLDDGNLITDSTLITKKYLKSWFLVDFITSLPISLIVDIAFDDEGDGSSVRAFKLLRFLRFVRIIRVFKAIRLKKLFVRMEEFVYSSVFNGIKGLVGLFFIIILVAHWVACIWHLVGSLVQDSTGDSWMIHYDIAEAENADRYIASMYWAIATMLTVGYGDILPVSTPERTFNIIVMLIGCAVFAYSMNSIGILVQNIQAGVSRTRQMYYNLSKYMDQKRVSKNIRSKVIHYLDYMIETQKHGKMVEDQLFSILSDNIKAELKKDINGQVLRENALLQKNFGNKFLSILSNSLEEKIFSPGEVIFDEMDKTCHMYFIATGTVELYYSDCNVILKKLERDNHFGEIAFFTGKERTAAARSSTFSDIFFIRRDIFLTIVEDYTGDKEMFHLIKDNLSLYNSFETLKLKCLLCNNEGHVARNCHRVHYVPDKDKIISKYHADNASFNKNFKRDGIRNQFRALGDLRGIRARAIDYCTAHPAQINKLLNDTFGTAFFNLVNKLKNPNRNETGNSPGSDNHKNLEDDDPEKQVTFVGNASSEFSPTSTNKSEANESNPERSKGKNLQRIMSRRKKLRQFLNPRFRMKLTEKKDNDKEAGNHTARDDQKEQRVTIIKMANGIGLSNQKVVFEVVDSNNQNTSPAKPNPTPPSDDIPLELVANFSIYFPHNNITNILRDLNDQKPWRKDSINSERFETRLKKLQSQDFKNKKKERKSFFFAMTPTSRKSKFLGSNAREFSFKEKDTPRSQDQTPAAGTATNAIYKFDE